MALVAGLYFKIHARFISQFVCMTFSDPERMHLGTSGALLVRILLGHGAAGPRGQIPVPGYQHHFVGSDIDHLL